MVPVEQGAVAGAAHSARVEPSEGALERLEGALEQRLGALAAVEGAQAPDLVSEALGVHCCFQRPERKQFLQEPELERPGVPLFNSLYVHVQRITKGLLSEVPLPSDGPQNGNTRVLAHIGPRDVSVREDNDSGRPIGQQMCGLFG